MAFLPFLRSWRTRSCSRRRSQAPRKGPRLWIEPLEPRNLLDAASIGSPMGSQLPPIVSPPGSVTPDYTPFVTKLYQDLLHRTASSDEIAYWNNVLVSGSSPQQVGLAFSLSAEYETDFIREKYQTILGREPDAGGLAYWLGAMQAGLSEKQLTVDLLTSNEFYYAQGGTAQDWVGSLYVMTLGRAPDAGGLGYWTHALQVGMSRPQLAFAFLDSAEANGLMVANAYTTYLQRPADGPGEVWWVNNMPATINPNQLMAQFVASPEYLTTPDNPSALFSTFVTITGITPDTGTSPTDGVTNVPNPTVSGTGTRNAPFIVAVDGAVNTAGTIRADGTWSAGLSPLPAGPHQITVRVPNPTGPASEPPPYTATMVLTGPMVTIQTSDMAGAVAPGITVTASDNTFSINPKVTINADLQHDGSFTDPGDQNIASASLSAGTATITLSGLAPGTYSIEAQASDLAGNVSISQPVSVLVLPGGVVKVMKFTTIPGTGSPSPSLGFIGSQSLTDLFNAYSKVAGLGSSPTSLTPSPTSGSGSSPTSGSGPAPAPGTGSTPSTAPTMTVAQFVTMESQYYVFDAQNDILVRVRLRSRDNMEQTASDLKNKLGMNITQVFPQQYTIEGYLPMANLMQVVSVTDFGAITPVDAAVPNTGPVDSQGDATILATQYRAATGMTGTGVTIGAISDSVSQVGSGLAGSEQSGALPASGVNVLQDGTSSADTDEGRGLLEVAHDIAPAASLAFTSADQGPQAMAQGIVALATQANAKVIVDDVTFPDEPFFNDGLVAQAVNQVVNDNNVTYVTSAGNFGNDAWTDQWRPFTGTLGGVTGTFQNFDSTGGNIPLQHFTLQPGQTIDLSFQWDSPFLEGGSPLPQYQVPNSLAALVMDSQGMQVLKSFADVNQNTGEALQRVIFTNDGSYGTNTFALAFQLVSGPAPTMLKWVRFDHNAPAQFQGAPAIFGHAAAAGALTVGAVPYNNVQTPEPFTSQGNVTILFDANGNRLATPQVRNKPDVAGPDGVFTADFPAPAPGQTSFPVFSGTSAAAAHVAGAAALLSQKLPSSTAAALDQALIQSAMHLGPAGWNAQTGAGLVQLPTSITAPTPPSSPMHVLRNVDVSHAVKANNIDPGTGGTAGTGGQTGSNILLNAFPNVDTSQMPNNEPEVDIAVDPVNPLIQFVASNQDTEVSSSQPEGLFAATSTNGGLSWNGRFMADGSDGLPTKACCDPSVAFDSFGNLFLTYLNDASNKAVLDLSTDGGQTFKEIMTWTAADQPKVATGHNSVWVVFNNGDVEAAGAPVRGLGNVGAFEAVEKVPMSTNGNFGTIAIGPLGQAVVSIQGVIITANQGPQTLQVAIDPDGLGPSGFNDPTPVTTTNVGILRDIPAQPNGPHSPDATARIVYDTSNGPHHGRLYMVYLNAADTTTTALNVLVTFSDDDGLVWSPPVRVNDDVGSGASHFFPRIAVDPTTGFVAVSWYDTRNDPTNTTAEIFATVSFDGGATFFPNLQIANGASNANLAPDPRGSKIGYGDYTGLAFFNNTFYPSWADNSDSTGNNPDGPLSGMDAMTAQVSVTPLIIGIIGQGPEVENNQTSDVATNMGVLTSTASVPNQVINVLPNGFLDYDWFRWSAGQAGTFTATVTLGFHVGDLELHVFTVNAQNTLINLANVVSPGATTLTTSLAVSADEPLLVEVKGRESSFGVWGVAQYSLDVSLQ
jgi:hypothetical protein